MPIDAQRLSSSSTAALSPSDPLDLLNHLFRDAYAWRRDKVVAALDPALAVIEDVLILRLHGERRVGPGLTRLYHELKTISHLPLAIQASVGDDSRDVDDDARTRLGALRKQLVAVEELLATRTFTPEQLARQRRIVAACREFVDHVLADGSFTAQDMVDFLRARTPDIQANLEDAARDQLETTHATVSAWKQDMTEDEWSRLLVIVAVAHMARTGNVAAQYFSVVLGESWEGRFEREDLDARRRVLTSEVVTDEQSAFAMLAMHDFDARASNKFFAEEGRLSRDVLGNAAERLLQEMFAAQPDPAT